MSSEPDKKQETIRTLFFSVFFLNAFGVFLFWLDNNWLQKSEQLGAILSIGGLLGLVLALSVLHQFILQSRLPVMERYVGTMLIHRIHRLNAYLIFCLLLLHPFLVTLGHSKLHDIGYLQQLVDEVLYYPWVWLALIATVILLGVIGLSINIVRRRLRYEYWYITHLSVYVAVLIAFWHQIANGTDLLSSDIFRAYWIAFYIAVLGSLAWFRFGKLVLQYFSYGFTVSKVAKEADVVVSIYISTKKPLPDNFFLSGQFGIWRFFSKKLWWQSHPFTISSGSPKNGLRLTPKAVGDYTADLQNIKPGTRLFFDGPHGVFTTERLEGAKPLFIAGGIGITPIRAILEGMGKRAKGGILIYNVKTTSDLALSKELGTLAKQNGVKIYHAFSEKAPKDGLKGRVDRELLTTLVPDVSKRKVALCGPPAMMNAVEQTLVELGVPKKHIFTERFAFTAK
jgi:predicted ferric reductase